MSHKCNIYIISWHLNPVAKCHLKLKYIFIFLYYLPVYRLNVYITLLTTLPTWPYYTPGHITLLATLHS